MDQRKEFLRAFLFGVALVLTILTFALVMYLPALGDAIAALGVIQALNWLSRLALAYVIFMIFWTWLKKYAR